jgi:hypothetical protein
MITAVVGSGVSGGAHLHRRRADQFNDPAPPDHHDPLAHLTIEAGCPIEFGWLDPEIGLVS